MIALAGTVFVASLLGSLHCAGMCGAFVAASSVQGRHGVAEQAAYHLGRLLTYLVAGALAGAIGGAIDQGGRLIGVQRLALVFAALTLVAFGLGSLAAHAGLRLPRGPWSDWLARAYRYGHSRLIGIPAGPRAMAIGLLSTLLPCGWLYAFVSVAAGTGSAWRGALLMAVFWTGTVPALAAIGAGFRRTVGGGRSLPVLASVALVVVGLWSLTSRNHLLDLLASGPGAATHEHGDLIDAARDAAETTPPCCRPNR